MGREKLNGKKVTIVRNKVVAQKWKALNNRGLEKPKTREEQRQRLKEAHGY